MEGVGTQQEVTGAALAVAVAAGVWGSGCRHNEDLGVSARREGRLPGPQPHFCSGDAPQRKYPRGTNSGFPPPGFWSWCALPSFAASLLASSSLLQNYCCALLATGQLLACLPKFRGLYELHGNFQGWRRGLSSRNVPAQHGYSSRHQVLSVHGLQGVRYGCLSFM